MEPQQTLYSHLTLLLWERESSSYSMDHVKLWNQRWKIETLLVRLERVLYVFSFAVQCRDWKCIAAKPTLKLQKLQTSKKGVREKESGETTSDNISIFHVIVILNLINYHTRRCTSYNKQQVSSLHTTSTRTGPIWLLHYRYRILYIEYCIVLLLHQITN